jgi:hypothetical protein
VIFNHAKIANLGHDHVSDWQKGFTFMISPSWHPQGYQ